MRNAYRRNNQVAAYGPGAIHGTGAVGSGGQWMIPSSIGQQIFTISTGVASGMAGFLLAAKLSDATHIHTKPLLIASAIASLASFAVVFFITGEFVNREEP